MNIALVGNVVRGHVRPDHVAVRLTRASHQLRCRSRDRLDKVRRQTYSFLVMRPTLFRRLVAGLAALAFIVTLGLQGMQAAAMATMKSDMSMSMTAPSDAAAGSCANCDGSGKGAAMQCQPVCAPSIAVLPVGESLSCLSQPARFEAENMSFDGRTGTPEPHPPKSAALL